MAKRNRIAGQTPGEKARDTEELYREMLTAHADELGNLPWWRKLIVKYRLYTAARVIVRQRLHLAIR